MSEKNLFGVDIGSKEGSRTVFGVDENRLESTLTAMAVKVIDSAFGGSRPLYQIDRATLVNLVAGCAAGAVKTTLKEVGEAIDQAFNEIKSRAQFEPSQSEQPKGSIAGGDYERKDGSGEGRYD